MGNRSPRNSIGTSRIRRQSAPIQPLEMWRPKLPPLLDRRTSPWRSARSTGHAGKNALQALRAAADGRERGSDRARRGRRGHERLLVEQTIYAMDSGFCKENSLSPYVGRWSRPLVEKRARALPPPLWGRAGVGGRPTEIQEDALGAARISLQRRPTREGRQSLRHGATPHPVPPHLRRPEGRPSFDGLWGAGTLLATSGSMPNQMFLVRSRVAATWRSTGLWGARTGFLKDFPLSGPSLPDDPLDCRVLLASLVVLKRNKCVCH